MRTSEELCRRFRELGHKITPQRRVIFQALEGDRDHLSAEDVYRRVRTYIPDISLATVYNTLRELVHLGEVRELDLGEGRSRFDPDTSGHQHLVCVGCQSLADITFEIPEVGLSPEEIRGYDLLGVDVTLYGVCPSCQKEREPIAWSGRLWGAPPGLAIPTT